MSKKRIYVAGPMRGIRYYNFPAFDAARESLERDGWEVVSPADLDRDSGFDPFLMPEDHDWSKLPKGFELRDIIRRDLDALLSCEAIYRLEGWAVSTGARAEWAVAQWANLETIHQ